MAYEKISHGKEGLNNSSLALLYSLNDTEYPCNPQIHNNRFARKVIVFGGITTVG